MAKNVQKQDNKAAAATKKGGESNLERARRMTAGSKKKEKQTVLDYWKGVKLEMSKVIWPTRKELITYTGVVVGTCAAFALGFWLIDTGFLALLKTVLGITLS